MSAMEDTADTADTADMCEQMNKQGFFEVCMGIEQLCADLYHFYSKIYEENPDASQLWKTAAFEEENHKRQFELALRLLNDTEIDVPISSLNRAYSVQYKLLKLTDHVKNNKPDLLTAVLKSVEMEEVLADLHAYSALKFGEESLQKLFKALSEADREHVAALQNYRSVLYLPLTEMEG